MQDYILNTWYMAAWANEITTELFSRKLLGKAVLVSRDENGEAFALLDRCPHRFAKLSMGQRDGDRITCGYHGLVFDTNGRCVHNPYSDRIPAGAAVDRFPVVEKDSIIWCWFGDPALADPATVPDFSVSAPKPGVAWVNGVTPLHSNYEYGTDNLMDLSHIEFLHTGTFAGKGRIFKGKYDLKQEGKYLQSNWWMPGVDRPTGFEHSVKTDMADHWLDMRWEAPATMHLQIGATEEGKPREAGGALDQAHILTPADAHETHYFWSSRSSHPVPPERLHGFRELIRIAFEVEDKPMVEAAYSNADGKFWELKPISLGIDTGGTRARRIVESLKRAEQTGSAGPVVKAELAAVS